MPLTKNDISELLDDKFEEKLDPITSDIASIRSEMATKADVLPLATKQDVNEIPGKVHEQLHPILSQYEDRISTLEQKYAELEEELREIKQHLGN